MPQVFVYGTLRSDGTAGHLLTAGTTRVASAILPGYALYGRNRPYPFVVPREGSEVRGEVAWLEPRTADATLTALDDYEGAEYRRTSAVVEVEDGDRVVAFLWESADPALLAEHERIVSGDWFDL
jgi:gamma-glutamylcyclotransferase (GGCT)/AIG2-like uncharacterized protein YtfP